MSVDILVIEDDPALGTIFRDILELESNYTVMQIKDGVMAMDALKNNVPRLIMLDLHLPHISGMDILAYIRQDQRFEETRIVVISADVLAVQKLENQVDKVLIKPIDIGDLMTLGKLLK